ncbi:MAG: tetratricopeptide repeat protein, partial [Ignavibacteria bacterium]
MANIIDFPIKENIKFGLRKVKKSREIYLKRTSQIDLFSPSSSEANVYILPTDLSPFEEALILDEQGDKRAYDTYGKAISADDCVADAYCNLGILEYEAGKTVKAIDCFTNSLKHEPRHFESHYNLANLYSEIGNLPLAKTHYEFAKELQPGFPDIYFNLGLVYAMTRDFESSVKV